MSMARSVTAGGERMRRKRVLRMEGFLVCWHRYMDDGKDHLFSNL
jgi:hypothetical protein